ncbi:hypothetical protein SVAN01_06710 [Stagonosporopsis vannaccii]|nr:hypothetical protein SVAN01_06710 [Stagonosporopsis vannaccii]
MAQARAYIPSVALLRALARPQPLRCPFARPLPARFVRGKKTKAAKAREAEKARLESEVRKKQRAEMTAEQRELDAQEEEERLALEAMKKDKRLSAFVGPVSKLLAEWKDPEKTEKYFVPPVFKEGESPGVDFYELDLDTGKKRKVDKVGSVADQIKARETHFMIEESYNNPDYDDAELNRRMMDGLIADPAFAEFTEDLKQIKAGIMTKEEEEQAVEEADKEAQPAIDELTVTIRKGIEDSLTMLINDPDVGDERADLQAVLDILPSVEDFEDPEFGALMDRATERVNSNPKLQAKLARAGQSQTPEEKEQWEAFQKDLEEMTTPPNEDEGEDLLDDNEIAELMREMREVMKTINLGGDVDKQLKKLLADNDMISQAEQIENDAKEDLDNWRALAEAKSNDDDNANEDEHIPPELAAMVDKIVADPRLMQKLDYISKLIDEHTPARDPNDLTQIDADLAPDPYEMEDTRTATLAQRMAAARADPEHSAAMRALRVKLQPPYNISPALKAFNQVIEFAYVGANDDVRRVLWRSYQKARTLPTFLQSLTDDAWDILYYSQAVTWTGNQNRTNHLKMLLRDLAATGRSGPPTHPSALGQHQEAARLEAAQREQREATKVRGEMLEAARAA